MKGFFQYVHRKQKYLFIIPTHTPTPKGLPTIVFLHGTYKNCLSPRQTALHDFGGPDAHLPSSSVLYAL